MTRPVKWLLGVVAALVLLVVAALAVVPLLVDTPRVQALIASQASAAVGRPVKFQSMSISVLPLPAVALHGLEIAEDPHFGTEPFVRLDTGKVRLKLGPLFSGRVELGDIILKKPSITIIQGADGRLNIATLGGTAEAKPAPRAPRGGGSGSGVGGAGALLTSKVSIDDGVVTYVTRGKSAATRYRVEGLDLTLTGGGPQLAFKGDMKLQPGALTVKIADGTLAPAPGKSLAEAPLRGAITLDGKDIGELAKAALGPTPELSGALKGKLALSGTVGAPSAAGDVELSKPTVTQVQASCPEPKRRTLPLGDLKMNVAYRDQIVSARPVTTSIAEGKISAQVSASLQQGVRVQVSDIGVKALPIEKVAVDWMCEGYAITGPLDFTGSVSFTASDVWNTLSGPGSLKVGHGKVVGSQALALVGGIVRVGGAVSALLGADLPNVGDTPLEFESITGTYQITNGVLATKDLLYTSRPMKVAIAGTYALASSRMDLDMVVNHGRGEIKAKVTGTTASPSIRVLPGSIVRDVDPEKAQKGLSDLLRRIR